MDDAIRGRKPPLEVYRGFTASRLEVQVLAQAYELIVPLIVSPVPTSRTVWDWVDKQAVEAPSRRMAQGV